MTLLRLVGSRACYRKSKPLKLIVSSETLPQVIIVNILFLPANFLRINIYLTQKIADDMLWNIAVNDAGADYDPLTLLRSRTMFGRPDWKSIYGRMRQAIESGQYLPGTNSQLKTTVGVCRMLMFMTIRLTLSETRHTSVALLRLQRPSRKRRLNIRRLLSTSLSPR